VSQRGIDPATERRRLRGSEDEEQDATGRLLRAIFWVSAEAFFFGLPTLVWTMLYGDVAVTFVLVIALSTFCLVGGIVRARGTAGARERDDSTGRGWPPMTLRLVAFDSCTTTWSSVGQSSVGQSSVG
jgi:hypothetical protein